MSKRIFVAALALMAGVGTPALAQQTPQDNLAVLAPLIGRWTGTSEGQPGNGTVERDYAGSHLQSTRGRD